jgi:hypothetical protein
MERTLAAICQIPALREVLDQQRDRQAALNFELAVDALACLLQHLARNVGRDNVDAPVVNPLAHFLEGHGKRIGLLSAGGSRTPDPDAPPHCAARKQGRDHCGAELVGWNFVPEEKRLVRRQGLDNEARERGSRPQAAHQLGMIGKA